MRVAAMASLGVRVHAPLGDAGKISRCVALGQPLIPAQAGIHLAPFFAYALWIPACAGMTHRRTTRRLSNIPALQFKMSDILTTIDAGIMTITLNRAGKKNAITSAMYASMADALQQAANDEAIRAALLQGHETAFLRGQRHRRSRCHSSLGRAATSHR